jgi:hypothetical protein
MSTHIVPLKEFLLASVFKYVQESLVGSSKTVQVLLSPA